jgi:hypothetical protein
MGRGAPCGSSTKLEAANVVLPVRVMVSPAEPSLFESVSVKLRK